MTKLAELMTGIGLIATDLETIPDPALPTHSNELYARPPVIVPESCPLMAVYTQSFAWQLLATPSYYIARPDVRIGWFVSAAKETETADGFGELMSASAAIADRLVERIVTYSQGIPGQDGTFGRLIETTTERGEGAVFGIVHRLELER